MIYVIISDGFCCQNEIVDKNRDCRILRQPHTLLPKEVKEYIEKTANDLVREERKLAYTALFAGLKEFFEVDSCFLKRTESGKPYLTDESDSSLLCPTDLEKNISVSLSHSDGIVAVALSDEGEIGVDIQVNVDSEKATRLEARFLSDVVPKNDSIEMNYFYMALTDDEAVFLKKEPSYDDSVDFLSKWVYAESVIKYFGLTFSEIPKINELSKNTKSQIISIENFKISTTIAK